MDRNREPRRSSVPATTADKFPKRRHRTIGLRDSSEEGGQVELPDTVKLRAVASKRDRNQDRDRDSSNKNKRRRGFHREEGEQSTEESLGNEQDFELEDAGVSRMLSPNTASSTSDQNHRRSFLPARPLRPSPPPWKITDEVIGVTVPRKARSASAKRPHDSWVSTSGGGEEQDFRHQSNSPGRNGVEAPSPSSSNVSVQKKMKAIGPKTRLPKTSKSSSSTQEDMEIEIAELLCGLMTSKNQESSQKPEPNGKLESNGAHSINRGSKTSIPSQNENSQNSVLPPPSNSPSPYLSSDVEKKKMEDFRSSAPASNCSISEEVKNENEQSAKVESCQPESVKISGLNDDNSTGLETKSPEAPKVEINKEKPDLGSRYGVTTDGRSVSVTGEFPSCSKSDGDKEASAATKVISSVPDTNSQRVEKFEIDLMAPPPMVLSPESDDLSRCNFTSQTRALAAEAKLKTENYIKNEDKEERLIKNAPERIKEAKIDTLKEKRDVPKIDLEMPNRDNDSLTRDKLEGKGMSQELPPKLTDPKVEKTDQSTPVSLSTTLQAWPSSLSSLGYLPPLQTDVKTDKIPGSSTAPQHLNFAMSPPQSKRCATHHYIARNIFLHQQFIRMNHIWPTTVVSGSGSFCNVKPNNINGVPTSETMGAGQQSQRSLPCENQNAAQAKKEMAATSFPGVHANKSSDASISLDLTQTKQQGPLLASACNLMHGPAFLFSMGQHQQSSVAVATSQAGGVNSTGSASSSNKSNSTSAGSLGTSSALPAVAATMSFSYPNLAANDAPYVTIVQNNGYPYPFSTPQGATASTRGASPAPAAHMLNGPFYSSQTLHPFQHPQQHPHSQASVQPSYLNSSTSRSSSSSHKQPHGAQGNGNNILSSTTMQLQQSQKQNTSQSDPRKLETKTSGENALSIASRTSYSQKNVYGQNFSIPVQPVNLSFRPSTTSDSVGGGNSGNFGDKQQQALKGGVEIVPSQAFAISFAAFNGTNVPSNLSFSSHSPVIFHSLPNVGWQGYHSGGTSSCTTQQKSSISEGKSGGNSTRHDDEKKLSSGKSSTNGPTTLVFDNSSKNLSFVLSPTNGSWPGHSIASTAIAPNAPLPSNASSSQQQLLQLKKHFNMQQQQQQQQPPPLTTRYKASSSTASSSKFVNNPSVFSQTFTQSNSSNPTSHSKSSGRTSDSQALQSSVITTTAPTLKNVPQEQGRVLQGHTQISFGSNYKSSLPSPGQQLLNNNPPLNTTIFAGSPPSGSISNSKPNSQGSKVGSSISTLPTQQAENSSTGTGQKSSPVCGRNVPSILTSGPSHMSELKY